MIAKRQPVMLVSKEQNSLIPNACSISSSRDFLLRQGSGADFFCLPIFKPITER
jgi:hypothetical protein